MELAPSAEAPETMIEATPVRLRAVAGTYNLRDTGGMRAETGATRWGRLYRSDALNGLGDEGVEQFAGLGVRTIIDLRDDTELEHSPSMHGDDAIETVRVPIFGGAAPQTLMEGEVTLGAIYHAMIDSYGRNVARAVAAIAASGDAPVLVHCTAGKDRTGVVIALALLAAGVDREEVVADYAATEQNLRGEWAAAMLAKFVEQSAVTPEIEAIIAASPASLIEEIIDRVDAEFGSAAGFLTANGVTEDQLQQLAAVLVDTAAPIENNDKESAS